MPIPPFGGNFVLPPHSGNPANGSDLSPYLTNTVELCQRFSTSKERVEILKGLHRLRSDLAAYGVVSGFQWIDGGFLEDIETSEKRSPRDIDVVTFYASSDSALSATLLANFPTLLNPAAVKAEYSVDHYLVDLNYRPAQLVEATRYWYGLFSHTRSNIWKGMLRIELGTDSEDAAALEFLDTWQSKDLREP